MKEETHQLIQRLAKCTYLPGSKEKRFVRQMAALPLDAVLTENQLMYLGIVKYRYRKQLESKGGST